MNRGDCGLGALLPPSEVPPLVQRHAIVAEAHAAMNFPHRHRLYQLLRSCASGLGYTETVWLGPRRAGQVKLSGPGLGGLDISSQRRKVQLLSAYML